MAIENYHEEQGCFPPAYLVDEQGRPAHSWRVLILPWLDQQEIYDRYRFDEPWDGPNNRALHELVVSSYACPSHPRERHAPSYVAVLGSETSWRGPEPMTKTDIKDGLNQTILLVEIASPSIHWMEPWDLELGRMALAINGSEESGIASGHPGGINALMVDGVVRFLKSSIEPRSLRAMLTASGGEEVEEY